MTTTAENATAFVNKETLAHRWKGDSSPLEGQERTIVHVMGR
jgi:hypothetical protein